MVPLVMEPLRESGRGLSVGLPVLLLGLILYVLSGLFGLALVLPETGTAPVWMPAGIGFALLYLAGVRGLAVIIPGAFVLGLTGGQGWAAALLTGCVHGASTFLAVRFMEHFLRRDESLETLRGMTHFTLAGVILMPVLNALIFTVAHW